MGHNKDKSVKVRDLLNNLVALECVSESDQESVVIRCSLALAVEALENWIYNAKLEPSTVPAKDVSGWLPSFEAFDNSELKTAIKVLKSREFPVGTSGADSRQYTNQYVNNVITREAPGTWDSLDLKSREQVALGNHSLFIEQFVIEYRVSRRQAEEMYEHAKKVISFNDTDKLSVFEVECLVKVKKISAIKAFRHRTGLSLKDSKEKLEEAWYRHPENSQEINNLPF